MPRPQSIPAKFLADELRELQVTPTELSRQIAMPAEPHIADHPGQARYHRRYCASAWALVSDQPPQFWLNLQSAYDLRIANEQVGEEVSELPPNPRDRARAPDTKRRSAQRPPAMAPSGQNRGFRAIRQARRHADRGASGRHVVRDHGPCPDLGTIANADVAKNGRPVAEQDAAADPRGAAGHRPRAPSGRRPALKCPPAPVSTRTRARRATAPSRAAARSRSASGVDGVAPLGPVQGDQGTGPRSSTEITAHDHGRGRVVR